MYFEIPFFAHKAATQPELLHDPPVEKRPNSSIETTSVLNWAGVFRGNADKCQHPGFAFHLSFSRSKKKSPLKLTPGGREGAKWPYLIRARLKDEGTAADVSCKLRVIGLIINSGQEAAPAYSHGQIVPAVHYSGSNKVTEITVNLCGRVTPL